MNKEKEVEAYLRGELPEEEKIKYEIAEEILTRSSRAAGKASRPKKPEGSEA